jgi:hypothetical protein
LKSVKVAGVLSLATLGLALLPAISASAVNTSYINFNDMPPSHENVACNYGTTKAITMTQSGAILNVQNNCSVRLWLHQYADGSGKGFCITHNTDPGVPVGPWRQIQVTSNTAAC